MEESREVALLDFSSDRMNEEESREVALLDFFSDRMNEYRVIIDDAISRELYLKRDSPFFEFLTSVLKGGKRLRSTLLLLAFQSVGGQEIDPLPAAVVVEIIHSGSLMIDDIIDEDLMRRDVEAFHASYGLKMSLLNTEILLSMMLDIMARYLDNRVSRVLAQACSSLGSGAFQELAVYTTKQPIDVGEYINILKEKTAFLFEASARIGALVAGAQENEVEALSNYGRLLGLAYQVQDDIADLEEDTSHNLLNFLDGKFTDERYFQKLSASYIIEAKQQLKQLKSSEAKILLIKLAEAIGAHSVNKVRHFDHKKQTASTTGFFAEDASI
jgi:octaprenyl-diphosphate synthase